MNDVRVLELLSSVGASLEAGQEPADTDLHDLEPADAINRKGTWFWDAVCAERSAEQIALLIKGLTYVEKHFKWAGGSAAGTIWLFAHLKDKAADRALVDAVCAWVIANTANHYSPFGTVVSLGAKNYSEYEQRSLARAREIARYATQDAEWEHIAAEKREARAMLSSADCEKRGSPDRAELIECLNAMTPTEQLLHLAQDAEHGPKYYPTRVAGAARQEVIDGLDKSVRLQLAEKLKGKQRGPWGSFKKRLLRTLDEPWNMSPWGV